MSAMTPSPLERRFLRAVAAVNPHARQGETGDWWSAYDLQSTALFTDFRLTATLSLAALGRSTAAKGFVRTRRIGTRGHGWTEYRITGYGRGLVADSCIGGGLLWRRDDARVLICPACCTPASVILAAHTAEGPIPAHPLPGYAPGQETRDITA